MKKCYVFIICFLITGSTYTQGQTKLVAAPDIVPPATEAMQHPEFWISRIKGDPDRIIMTWEQIKRFNIKNRTRSLERKDIHGNTVKIDSVITQGNFYGIQFHLVEPLTIKTLKKAIIHSQIRLCLNVSP